MLLNLINFGIAFVQANAPTAMIVMGIMAYVKKATQALKWRKPWMLAVAAFALSFAFTVPADMVLSDWPGFIAQGVMLGLTVTGVYDALKKQ